MGPPVRVVCRGCLRSVEVDPGEDVHLGGSCPFCGQPLDSRLARSGSTVDLGTIFDSSDSDLSEAETTTDWVTMWARGSLGRLGRFQLRERLGDGGFGEVFLAYDPRLDRDVALKVLREANPSERVMERFFREARAAARLDHPNIVSVHDAGFDKGRCWVAYQYVKGRPLWWYRDHHPLTLVAVARIFRDLAGAVDYAHRQGVVHRDLKPANVLIDDRGRPRLIDFGLARRADRDSSLTHDGAVVGTPAYMSPEQALGQSRQVDERSDVYSLGVILHEILAGRRPDVASTLKTPNTASKTPQASGREKLGAGPATVVAFSAGSAIPPSLDRICKRATAAMPEDRYPTAREFADDLDAWLLQEEKPKARSTSRKLGIAATVASLLTLCLAFGFFWIRPLVVHPKSEKAAALPGLLATLWPGEVAAARQRPSTAGVAPKARPKAVPLVSGEIQLVGNLKKKRYHLADCEDIKAMSELNQHMLKDVDEAAARGLKPCEHCHPPSWITTEEGDPESP